jgi:hypothetical protein
MVEIPGQIWTDQIYEGYVLKDLPHRGTEDQEFGSPVIEISDSRDDKSDERTRFFRRISGSVMTVGCEEEMSALSWGMSVH